MLDERPRFTAGLKRRPAVELINRFLFRPLGFVVVRLLWRTPVRPEHLVLLHGFLGLLAGSLLASGHFFAAALLLQLVTVLDNADGQLARSRGQESLLGRYLDTEVDFLVHVALFLALARVCGAEASLAGLVSLTLLLGLDYNLVEARREPAAGEPENEVERILATIYGLVFGWQDALMRRLEHGLPEPPGWLYWLVANLGRTTQFAALGLALALGRPCVYVRWLPIVTLVVLLVYAGRIWRSGGIRYPR
ncbi:CDP-alcohol phosphatidyltransferase family protein [Oceanithermus sp.]